MTAVRYAAARPNRRLGALGALILISLAALPTRADDDALVREYLDRGIRDLASGAAEHALQAFDDALAVRAEPAACLGRAVAQFHLGRRAEALQGFRSASADMPGAAAMGEALAALAQGEFVAARTYLIEADEFGFKPEGAPRAVMAYTALLQGHYGESGQFAQEALAEEPADYLALLTLAEVYIATGRPSRAGDRVRRVLELMQRDLIEPGCGPLLCGPEEVLTGKSPIVGMGGSIIAIGDSGRKRIEITTPLDGAVVRGAVPIAASIIGDEQEFFVAISVNGRMVWSGTQLPYRYEWDARDRVPGDYIIGIQARLGIAGDALYEDEVVVRVTREAAGDPGIRPAVDAEALGRLMFTLMPQPSGDWLDSLRGRLTALTDHDPSQRQPTLPPGWEATGQDEPTRAMAPVPRPVGAEPMIDEEPVDPATLATPAGFAPRGRKVVTLLFDDGPHPVITPAILSVLRTEDVQASFFLVGTQAEQYPELVRRIAYEGHDVGNHTYHHLNLDGMLVPEIEREVLDNKLLIESILARPVTLFRAPGEHHGPRVRGVLSHNGLVVIPSTINTWPIMALSPEEIVESVMAQVKDGDSILLHNGQDKSIYCLPLLIRRLRDEGFEFTTATEMLQQPGASRFLAGDETMSAPEEPGLTPTPLVVMPPETEATAAPVEPTVPRSSQLGARRPTGR